MTEFKEGREVLKVQGYSGNWDYGPYMHGLYNGMEMMLSLIENREPSFKDAPKKWKRPSFLRRIKNKIFPPRVIAG